MDTNKNNLKRKTLPPLDFQPSPNKNFGLGATVVNQLHAISKRNQR
jgi:hypothetical protein